MARGIAIPEVREQIVRRGGPGAGPGRPGRADHAGGQPPRPGSPMGCCTGTSVTSTSFLASFVAGRLQAIADGAAVLPGRAGRGSVTGNSPGRGGGVRGANAQDLMSLVATKPELSPALQHAAGPGRPRRQSSGISPPTSTPRRSWAGSGPMPTPGRLAFTLLGAVHHLVITRRGGPPDLRRQCGGSWPRWSRVWTPTPPGHPEGPDTANDAAERRELDRLRVLAFAGELTERLSALLAKASQRGRRKPSRCRNYVPAAANAGFGDSSCLPMEGARRRW